VKTSIPEQPIGKSRGSRRTVCTRFRTIEDDIPLAKPDFLGDRRLDSRKRAALVIPKTLNASSPDLRYALRVNLKRSELFKSMELTRRALERKRRMKGRPKVATSNSVIEHVDTRKPTFSAEYRGRQEMDTNGEGNFRRLLKTLKEGMDIPSAEVRDAVLDIQVTAIPEGLKSETISVLADFVRLHRSSNVRNVIIAVGAAIRKLMLNLPDDDFALATLIMKPSDNLEVPIEVELEVAKMVVHRFRHAPSTTKQNACELAGLLLDIAMTYSRPSLVNRDRYGAVALNSVLAIVLMMHEKTGLVIAHINTVSPRWFVDLVKNRLRRMAKEMAHEKRLGAENVTAFILESVFEIEKNSGLEGQ
jgi:hypothetical protein